MAIKTTIATHFKWREIIIAVVCVGLAGWGAWDAFVTIPADNQAFDDYQDELDELSDLEERVGLLSAEDMTRYEELQAKDVEPPKKPNTFDIFVQWMFISCILYVPWAFVQVNKLDNQVYELDDHGNLTLVDGSVWKHDDIAGIDMGRWMSKSIAIVKHTDGSTHKLDAYYRKNMEQIIGHLGHRFDPDQWNLDGTRIVEEEDDLDDEDSDRETTANASRADPAGETDSDEDRLA